MKIKLMFSLEVLIQQNIFCLNANVTLNNTYLASIYYWR